MQKKTHSEGRCLDVCHQDVWHDFMASPFTFLSPALHTRFLSPHNILAGMDLSFLLYFNATKTTIVKWMYDDRWHNVVVSRLN